MEEQIKLLIVEDESIAALFLQKIFTKYGFHVVKVVATGKDAVDSALNDMPDAILMDINLIGKMNGIEAAEEILLKRKVPIIFATGYDDEENRTSAEKLNPAGYFTKPITLEKIEMIANLFKKSCDIAK